MKINTSFRRHINYRQRLAAGLLLLVLGAGSLGRSLAETHLLPSPSPNPWGDWEVWAKVEGQDVKCFGEGEQGDSESHYRVILYTVPKEATVTVYADFHGSLPEGVYPVSQEIGMTPGAGWTVAGGVAVSTVNLVTNQEVLAQRHMIQGVVTLHTTDPNYSPSRGFLADLFVARPIGVSAGGSSGGALALYAHSQVPCMATNPITHVSWADASLSPLPDAEVKAEAIEGVEVSSGWLTTGELGRAMATVRAPASSIPDAVGLVSGRIRIKAVKDRATVQREVDIHIPYASVAGAYCASLIGRAGAILEPQPIVDGDNLRPGDVVQVGNEFLGNSPYLNLWFCNGQRVVLQSDTVGGIRAVVGQGSLDQRTPVFLATLENVVQNIQADPRRYGRMMVYKAIGNAVDGLLGIPDPVGWTVTTPGGAVENWVGNYVEGAYQPQKRSPSGGHSKSGSQDSSSPDAAWAGSVVDFYSDGTARAYNRGATLNLHGPSASGAAPLNGMLAARLDAPGGPISSPGLAPRDGFAPFISFEPTNGASGVPIRPRLRAQFLNFGINTVLPGSLFCRLDGRLLQPQERLNTSEFVWQTPAAEALTPGLHQWDIEFALLQGGLLRTSVTFSVTEALPAPRTVRAAAGLQRVALRWDAEALAWARGGFRVYRAAPGNPPVLISGSAPLRQPNFVDLAPLASGNYEVAGLDAAGNEGPRSAPVTVLFPGSAPPVPQAVAVTVQAREAQPGFALGIDDFTPGFTLWRIEAATNAGGPFTNVLEGELTSLALWPVPRPFEETRPWYRVTALNVDGVAGPPVTAGPLALPVALPGVAGLTALPNSNGTVQVRWDAWTARAILGYRVERGFDGKWTLAADVDASTQTWTETQSGDGVRRQWRVRARLAGGALSPASPAVEFCLQPVPAHPGNIRFANATVTGAEGESLPIRIVREGGSDGPAFVTWSSWGWAGSATPEADYTPGAGLLIFAPGETEKTVNVALQADNLREQPAESFYVYLKQVEGGPGLAEPSITQAFITDGPELAWESIWLYASENDPPEVRFHVRLDPPANHPVSVGYEFQAGGSTATPGADFTGPLTGTLTFAPGQTNQFFAVQLINDTLKEGTQPETVQYRLTNPQGAAIDDRDPFRLYATLEIRDDDTRPGRAVFADRTVRLREGESRAITLRREGGADGELGVFLFGMGGNAQLETDWAINPNFPSFADGQTNLSVTLSALTDAETEGAEMAILGAQGMGGYHRMATLFVVIEDATAPASGFAAWAAPRLAAFPAEQRGPYADPDGDGTPNWAEFLWRTNPAQPDRPAPPQSRFTEWGEWLLTVTVTEDPALLVVAEFSKDVTWTEPEFLAGNWETNGDGTRTGTFHCFNFGGSAGFIRFRGEWCGSPQP